LIVFFFFQAEDGIRDFHVTGVQTCALPISGTLVVQELDTVSVTAEATSLPDRLEASVAGLDAGAQITAADLPLPEGTELVSEPDTVLVVVTASPTAAEMGVEEAPAEGEESGEAS